LSDKPLQKVIGAVVNREEHGITHIFFNGYSGSKEKLAAGTGT
jgi:hypothetical protein